jgi:hypothetical protein
MEKKRKSARAPCSCSLAAALNKIKGKKNASVQKNLEAAARLPHKNSMKDAKKIRQQINFAAAALNKSERKKKT